MKKYLILLMLGFITSFGVYASGIEKKESVKLTSQKESTPSSKVQIKIYREFCMEVQAYIGECPDGSEFLGAVAYILTDCDSGQAYGFFLDYISDAGDSC